MKNKTKLIKPTIYSVSYQDMLELWIEFMHPEDNIVLVWDARNHLEILEKSGFILDIATMYDNKMLTIVLDDVIECFYVMDVLSSYEEHPFMQIYSQGSLLTDNLENLREEITT